MSEIIDSLTRYCKSNGERVTPPRRFVLEIIATSPKPITAYDVLTLLNKHLDDPKPPTVYRALEFLSEHGFIHRIESLNAYIACKENHKHEGSQFMICDKCGQVEEAHLCHVPPALKAQAEQKSFKINYWNVEIHGCCKNCS
ncbi:MAG: transcriptional repressor [Micavibrio sp.]|nr:transcriptional repressor [Micavibrio sp.]|tara:strand:+ start:114 stop:539 length:426 start_codon:yes stop_codon:yes gene_type:complete